MSREKARSKRGGKIGAELNAAAQILTWTEKQKYLFFAAGRPQRRLKKKHAKVEEKRKGTREGRPDLTLCRREMPATSNVDNTERLKKRTKRRDHRRGPKKGKNVTDQRNHANANQR